MVIKVYTSGISGNKEVKKRQQRIMMILESKSIAYEAIDITEPGKELEKQFMQDNAKAKDSKHPLPPQIFNEDDYCGDYEGFDLANENDELEIFLKLPLPPSPVIEPPPPVINGTTEVEEEPEEPEVVEEVVEEVPVHGFCYTPSLAKRLEKALKARLKRPHPKSVHGFCYTPSLASRLAKALEMAFLRKKSEGKKKEDVKNDDDAMDEDNKETEKAVNNEEMNEENGGTNVEEE